MRCLACYVLFFSHPAASSAYTVPILRPREQRFFGHKNISPSPPRTAQTPLGPTSRRRSNSGLGYSLVLGPCRMVSEGRNPPAPRHDYKCPPTKGASIPQWLSVLCLCLLADAVETRRRWSLSARYAAAGKRATHESVAHACVEHAVIWKKPPGGVFSLGLFFSFFFLRRFPRFFCFFSPRGKRVEKKKRLPQEALTKDITVYGHKAAVLVPQAE